VTKVAPIDDKSGSRNKFDPEFLRIRNYYLQEFMNSITEHPELRLSPHLNLFLKCQDGEPFEKAKKDLEKVINPNSVLAGGPINKKMFYLKNPIKVEHLTRIEGSVECKIDSKLKDVFVHTDTALKEWMPAYAKCRQTSLLLSGTLDTAKNQAEQLATEIEALQKATSKLNDGLGRQSEYPWETLETIYSTLSDTLRGFSRTKLPRPFSNKAIREHPRLYPQHFSVLRKRNGHAARASQEQRRGLDLVLQDLLRAGGKERQADAERRLRRQERA
jgi:hypothetical protein